MTNTQRDEHKNSLAREILEKINQKIVPVFLLISVVVSFCMLVIGSLNVHECPVNKCIPIFLIATGAMGVLSKILSFIRKRNIQLVEMFYVKSAESVLYFAEVIFLFLGTYWVFKEFQPSFKPDDKNYCNKTAYIFAFSYLTVHYTLLIIAIFGLLVLTCCMATSRHSYSVESPSTSPEPTERLTLREAARS